MSTGMRYNWQKIHLQRCAIKIPKSQQSPAKKTKTQQKRRNRVVIAKRAGISDGDAWRIIWRNDANNFKSTIHSR